MLESVVVALRLAMREPVTALAVREAAREAERKAETEAETEVEVLRSSALMDFDVAALVVPAEDGVPGPWSLVPADDGGRCGDGGNGGLDLGGGSGRCGDGGGGGGGMGSQVIGAQTADAFGVHRGPGCRGQTSGARLQTADAFGVHLGRFGPAEYERVLAFVCEAVQVADRGPKPVSPCPCDTPPTLAPTAVSLQLLLDVVRLGGFDWHVFYSVAWHMSSRLPGASKLEALETFQTAQRCFDRRVVECATEWALSDVLYRRWLGAALRRCHKAARDDGRLYDKDDPRSCERASGLVRCTTSMAVGRLAAAPQLRKRPRL